MKKKRFYTVLKNLFRWIVLTFGMTSILLIILAFTSTPFWIWYKMSVSKAGIHRPPDYIVVLGGGGMPSETGMMRCWFTAKAAERFPQSRIIIALPGDTADSTSSLVLMKKELIMRGITPQRIGFEGEGTNTRAQAVNIFSSPPSFSLSPKGEGIGGRDLLLVTSPEHLYRAVCTFRKAGFQKVDGLPSFERAIESDITFNAGKLGGRRFIPDVGESITMRYGFWTQIKYEQLVLREYLAIGYYWLMGWI